MTDITDITALRESMQAKLQRKRQIIDTLKASNETIEKLRGEVEKQMLEKRLVTVKDIGKVIDGLAEQTSISRYNGAQNISVAIQKQSNANTIQVVDLLRKELKFLEEDLTARGLQVKIIYDHSIFIRESLEVNAGYGATSSPSSTFQ